MTRCVAAIALAMTIAATCLAAPASAAPDEITLTFIRHGQSAGNTSGFVDTSTPGPALTELGREQAARVPLDFADDHFDGIFASTMQRTQQTAQPLAEALGLPVVVLPGLREIEAGVYEGKPDTDATGYFEALKKWATGDLDARIPGSIDGHEFDARFDEAVEAIYATGDQRPVAFAHGGSIALWTALNAHNADPGFIAANPLNNTGYVVLRGNPTAGWTLVDWNGKEF